MNHAMVIADITNQIYRIEKDAYIVGAAVLIVIVGIYAFKLMQKSL